MQAVASCRTGASRSALETMDALNVGTGDHVGVRAGDDVPSESG